jgi:hypothetical protein
MYCETYIGTELFECSGYSASLTKIAPCPRGLTTNACPGGSAYCCVDSATGSSSLTDYACFYGGTVTTAQAQAQCAMALAATGLTGVMTVEQMSPPTLPP